MARIVLAFLLTMCLGGALNAAADQETVTVEVTGVGPTYESARADAVRQALQLALSQLVILDRIVSEDRVLRDRIISTSNGYVERYLEKNLSGDPTGFSVDAEITVSATRIQNFVGVGTGGGGEIVGSLLGEEVQRRHAGLAALEKQSEARQRIFERIFEHYPLSSVNIELRDVSISPKNPDVLVLELEQTYKEEFVQALEGTLEALALHECRVEDPRNYLEGTPRNCPRGHAQLREILGPHLPEKELPFAPTYSTICVGHAAAKQTRCYYLDHGARLTNESVKNDRFQVFGIFVDDTGRSALTEKKCLAMGKYGNLRRSLAIMLETRTVQSWLWNGQRVRMWSFQLSTEPVRFEVEIDSKEVDLRRATRLIAVAGMLTRDGKLVGLTAERSEAVDACEVVADAVRKHLMGIGNPH